MFIVQRSVARVEWSTTGKSNIYSAGHKGKVMCGCMNDDGESVICHVHVSTG